MKLIALVTLSLLAVGCSTLEVLPPQQDDVNRIVVKVKQTDIEDNTIELVEPGQISETVAFINARTEGWRAPFSDQLEGVYELAFYRESRFVGNFYVGDDFFGRDYGTPWLRDATQQEIQAFITILNLDINLPEQSVRCAQSQLSSLNKLIMSGSMSDKTISEIAFAEISPSYPNWCDTKVNDVSYRIYQSNVSKQRFLIEILNGEDEPQRFGPFKAH